MFQRVLWVSLTQALRSVALVLLPTAFISLLAWATAGSSSGDTTDPMRVAAWMWLGAHHVPFHLVLPPAGLPGLFSYLPLGALIFPLLAVRSGFLRAFDRCDFNPRSLRSIRILFAFFYSGVTTLLAWASASHSVRPNLYFAPVNSLLIVLLASVGIGASRKKNLFSPSRTTIRLLAIALGISSIVLGVSMFLHLKTIEDLTLVLQPGLLGGVLLFGLMILYIPNAVLATFAYLVGPGFAVGAHTLVSATTHRVLEIPALPLLGALPTGRHPLVLFSALMVVVGGMIMYSVTTLHNFSALVKTYFFTLVAVCILTVLSSGSLLTRSLGSVGPSPWRVTTYVAVELFVGIFLAWTVPMLTGALRDKIAR